MKKQLCALVLLITSTLFSQVRNNTTTPHASAMLDITSTTKGFLIPRMDKGQRDLISTPATGLLIYQTNNIPGFYYYNGTVWIRLGGAYTFQNGLTENSGVAKLGGSLTNQTDINTNGTNYFKISTPTKTQAFYVDPVTEAIYFGNYTNSPWDGDAINLDGYNVNVELISKSHNGNSLGTGVGVGSIEYLTDGESTIASSDTFIPVDDNTSNLGTGNIDGEAFMQRMGW